MTQKTTLDASHDAAVRRTQEAERRLAGLAIAAADRPAARRTALAQVEAEELTGITQAAAQSEASAERTRIASVVKLGRDMDRGRQALRAALLAPITSDMAKGVLAAMPRDDAASAEALAVPGHVSFGTTAAQAERRRIAGAFARPEATARFGAVASLTLEGDAGLTGEQIAPLLASLPADAEKLRIPSIAERAAGAAEFGGETVDRRSKSETIAAGWSKAVAAANASLGAGAVSDVTSRVDPAAPVAGATLDPSHPHFGLTPEGIAAAVARERVGNDRAV